MRAGDAIVRPLRGEDAEYARALLMSQFGGTRYCERLLEQAESALRGDDAECLGIVTGRPGQVSPGAFALYGNVAGSVGTAKLHVLVGDDPDELSILARSLIDWSMGTGTRLTVHESGADACFVRARAVLGACGFAEEGFVPDWFADGVGLHVLVHRSAD